ncbi:MAG: hypothetical protein OS130_03115 [Thermodesulfobacteriota bacterium]|nr:MAG: hypothetical protein OS130_03115 [Thermodesulfobacteriota bacterium]
MKCRIHRSNKKPSRYVIVPFQKKPIDLPESVLNVIKWVKAW